MKVLAADKKKDYHKPSIHDLGSMVMITRDAGKSQPIFDDSKCGSMEIDDREPCGT